MRHTSRASLEFSSAELTQMRKQAERWMDPENELEKFPDYVLLQLLMMVQLNEKIMLHPVNSKSGLDKALRAGADFLDYAMMAINQLKALKKKWEDEKDPKGKNRKIGVDTPAVRRAGRKSYIPGAKSGTKTARAPRKVRG